MFQATLVQCATFKKIIDALKQLVKNINIDVNPKGISIQAMDSCHIAFASLTLKETAFKPYNCIKPFTIGINIQNVAKILKIADGSDSMTLSCDQQPSELKFKFQSKNGQKISEFNLSLLEMDSQGMGIPDTQYGSICKIPSAQFIRICKQFGSLSQTIKIQTSKQAIKFSINGQIGAGTTSLKQRGSGTENELIELQVDSPVCQSFAARYLNIFARAGSLSSQVILHMEQQTPLLVTYKLLEGLGQIKYYLAPKITQQQ